MTGCSIHGQVFAVWAKICSAVVADAMQWMMQEKGSTFVDHYIDDFIIMGRPGSDERTKNAKIMHGVCKEAGAPVEEEKSKGPATRLPFLGIEMGTLSMELRLPSEKLTQLQQILWQWRGKKVCRKRDIQSIIRSLSHACKVIRPSRSFLRHLIDLSKLATHSCHHLHLSLEARSDLEWWHRFAVHWNGVSMFLELKKQHPDIQIVSEASGKWGCGAFWNQHWFQLKWHESMQHTHITYKELVPVVLAAAVWGREWLD